MTLISNILLNSDKLSRCKFLVTKGPQHGELYWVTRMVYERKERKRKEIEENKIKEEWYRVAPVSWYSLYSIDHHGRFRLKPVGPKSSSHWEVQCHTSHLLNYFHFDFVLICKKKVFLKYNFNISFIRNRSQFSRTKTAHSKTCVE